MALKLSHVVFITLWLSLLFFLFPALYSFKSKQSISTSSSSSSSSGSSSAYSSLSRYPLINRKVLASKFDFTPFQKHRQQQQEEPSSYKKVQPQQAAETEIDPRYGVEKRLVPTGPNPLHHR